MGEFLRGINTKYANPYELLEEGEYYIMSYPHLICLFEGNVSYTQYTLRY